MLAGATGLEPATSAVTGQRSNQLSYAPVKGGGNVENHLACVNSGFDRPDLNLSDLKLPSEQNVRMLQRLCGCRAGGSRRSQSAATCA